MTYVSASRGNAYLLHSFIDFGPTTRSSGRYYPRSILPTKAVEIFIKGSALQISAGMNNVCCATSLWRGRFTRQPKPSRR